MDQNVRGLFKILNLQLPKDLNELMKINGAAFFETMSKGKQNKFEVKTINSTLGFLETGLIREADDLKNGVAQFAGQGLKQEQKGQS